MHACPNLDTSRASELLLLVCMKIIPRPNIEPRSLSIFGTYIQELQSHRRILSNLKSKRRHTLVQFLAWRLPMVNVRSQRAVQALQAYQTIMAESSTMKQLPPPFVTVDGLNNVRDIGTWPIFSGDRALAHVRSGLVFRGPDVTRISETGIKQLQDLGIATNYDLRSQQQLDRMGTGPTIPGIERIWVPVFGVDMYTEEKAGLRYQQYAGDGTEGIVQAFVEILTHGAPAFKKIMEHISSLSLDSDRKQALYLNCTTGNNRTGPFIATLLRFLGVPAEIVAQEYALSQQGLAPSREKTVARLRSNSKFAASFDAGELEYRAERMSGAREESMEAFLEVLEKKWGGAEGYFRKELGLEDDVLDKVKQVLVEPDFDGSRERVRRGSVLSSPVDGGELTRALSEVM